MPTPTEMMEARKRLMDCRVCAWLDTLDPKDRAEWQKAIINRSFGAALAASVVSDEINRSEYSGPTIGESSVDTHRARGHR